MENQSISNTQGSQQLDNSSTEPTKFPKQKTHPLLPILITFLVSAAIFGTIGFYIGKGTNKLSSERNQNYDQSNSETINTSRPESVEKKVSSDKADWLIYRSDALGLTIEYPKKLTKQGDSNFIQLLFGEMPVEGPGDSGVISIQSMGSYAAEMFNALYNASVGEDVPLAHGASDVKVEKVKNLNLDKYQAVEYYRDGVSLFNNESGRGPLGYEHNFIIKISEEEYILLTNAAMNESVQKTNDGDFLEMVLSLKID